MLNITNIVFQFSVIDTKNEEQCIKAFEDLYLNEKLRNDYIAKGLERAKQFSWEKTVTEMTNIMLSVIKTR